MPEDRMYQCNNMELNIRDLFWSVLCHWRALIAALLIGGLVLGVFGAFKEYKNYSSEAVREERKRAFELAMESYEVQKERLETDLENLKVALDQQRYYAENSLMLLVDQYNVSFITASYYVNTDYEIAPELVFQNPNYTSAVVRSYDYALSRMNLNEVVKTANEPNLTAQNPVGSAKKMLVTAVDDANGILTITISADNAERAETIYGAVKEKLAEQKSKLDQVIKDHSITLLTEQRYTGVDTDYGKLQTAFKSNMNSISDGIATTNKSLSELKTPSDNTLTIKSVVKTAIKYGVLGAVAGLLILTFFFMLKIVCEDRINSAEDPVKRYDLPVLGTFWGNNGKRSKLDRYFAAKLGLKMSGSTAEAAGFISANLRIYLKDSDKLMLIGNCPEELKKAIREQIAPLLDGIEVIVGGNINESSAAVNALRDKTAVVCVEEWMKTSHKAIRHELQTIQASGNNSVGLIMTL